MKRIILVIALIISASTAYGQKSIDALFDKYSGKDGFVTVTFTGNLLKLIFEDENNDNPVPSGITELRILAQEDDNQNAENFYDLAIKGIDLNNYEEFMRVKEKNQDVRMLVRAEGNKFREFLLIAGGEDNVIIQLKGEMTYKEAKKFSEDAKKNRGLNIMANQK
jgi:hypothetical protein